MNNSLRVIVFSTTLIGLNFTALTSHAFIFSVFKRNPEALVIEPQAVPTPKWHDGGHVLTESYLPDDMDLSPEPYSLPDCAGPSLAVRVDNIDDAENYYFDKDGNPCGEATVLFDGGTPAGTRVGDPGIRIFFQDKVGTIPPQRAGAPVIKVPSQYEAKTPEDFAVSGKQMVEGEEGSIPSEAMNLEEVISNWQSRLERERQLRESEELLAGVRDLQRMTESQAIDVHREKIEELMANMRQLEGDVEAERLRQKEMLDQMNSMRRIDEAKRIAAEQQESVLQSNLAEMKKRLQEFEQQNARLALEKAQKEKLYIKQIKALKGDLAAAEEQSSAVRKELVLEAAQKIAEAERIAFAARMAETDAMSREAERLRSEGDIIMQRAMDLQKGRAIIVPNVSDQLGGIKGASFSEALKVPLGSIPVKLVAEDVQLGTILENIFNQIQPHVGSWRVSWQLAPEHEFILEEKWTMAAEARFDEIMDFLAKKVYDTHQIPLNFKEFKQNRLFVITDVAL